MFSQGDVAVGRITRVDVANVLVSLLNESNAPAAVGKTLEVLALQGKYRYEIYVIIPLTPQNSSIRTYIRRNDVFYFTSVNCHDFAFSYCLIFVSSLNSFPLLNSSFPSSFPFNFLSSFPSSTLFFFLPVLLFFSFFSSSFSFFFYFFFFSCS